MYKLYLHKNQVKRFKKIGMLKDSYVLIKKLKSFGPVIVSTIFYLSMMFMIILLFNYPFRLNGG